MPSQRFTFPASLSILFALFLIAIFGPSMLGQEAQGSRDTHYADDWTHHHLVFSNPGTEQQALDKDWQDRWSHAHDRWLSITNDPRFVNQLRKRNSGLKEFEHSRDHDGKRHDHDGDGDGGGSSTPPSGGSALNLDWNSGMIAAGQVQPNTLPAKFSFSTTSASCTDFVVYPTGAAAATGAASIVAYDDLYGTNTPTETGCGSASVTVPSVYWAYTTGTGYSVSTSPIFSQDGNQVAYIQSNGTNAQLVLLKPKANNGILTTPIALTVQGSASAYRSCTAPCYFAVSLGATTLDTYSAPYYDYAGDDAIYVGDDNGKLHKITGVFYGSTIAEATGWPVTLNATYKTISPVYDPSSGYVFVGNTGGYLYAESPSGGTPHGTSSNLGDTIIDAPIVDSTAGKVYAFVTTATSTGTQGLTGCSVPGSFFGSSALTCSGGGLTSADVGAVISGNTTLDGQTIIAVGSSTTATLSGTGGFFGVGNTALTLTLGVGSNAVYQFATSFTTGAGTGVTIGTGGTGYYLYDGDFDNVYYSSTGGTAGDLWVVGNTGAGTGGGTLYRIPIGAGSAMSTPVAVITGLTDTTNGHYPWPSPITEYCHQSSVGTPCSASGGSTTGGTDYIYFSVDRVQATTGTCTNTNSRGCLFGYSINTPTSAPTLAGGSVFNTVGTPGCWATSGISIDNSVSTATLAGASQIYFIALNGNSAGGNGNATSAQCGTFSTGNTPSAMQESQSAP